MCSTDFKASDIEVGFSSVADPRFRKLAESEIEVVLSEMHDAMWTRDNDKWESGLEKCVNKYKSSREDSEGFSPY